MTTFAIAGLQLEAAKGDNSARMIAEIEAVACRYPWVEMVVLPELNACGADRNMAEPMPGPREKFFSEIARKHGIWLIPGSLHEQDGDRLFNTVPVINPDGEVIARYRKQFPWMPYEAGISPGEEFVVFDVPNVGRFGVSNCYDMWFPETIRAMTWMGAEVILHPSLTSTRDRDAEIAMIRAHGAQNQVYFFDVNLAGPLGVGESCVAGPGGEVVHQAGKGREIMPIKLDLGYLREVRDTGWQNLGQPLKSFRDATLSYPQYEDEASSEALDALGKLQMAKPPERS